ncbi:MAG TPA: metallophosphoesterase [Spirochaetes bacterium]|nr:metallophosphoesterase [Spirochaetota bacterium]
MKSDVSAGPIGIMADSHGRCSLIEEAAALLRGMGCGRLFHLGDICDSGMPETARECVRFVRELSIEAVKGNNDHILVVNQKGNGRPAVDRITLDFLAELPPLLEVGSMAFTHSLPFYSWMGAAALMRVPEDGERSLMFYGNPYSVIFRGHSHRPEYFRLEGDAIDGAVMKPGDAVGLSKGSRYVFTCGALIEGFALTLDREKEEVRCHSL